MEIVNGTPIDDSKPGRFPSLSVWKGETVVKSTMHLYVTLNSRIVWIAPKSGSIFSRFSFMANKCIHSNQS